MKDTLVVNLIASPSSGKSTMASDIFAKLKWRGVECELVSEFSKDLVWEERHETFKNEIYIFAKQHHRLFRLNGKVDVIVTDRPLILSMYYNIRYGDGKFDSLNDLVLEQHNKFNNFNVFLHRKKEYNPNGRNQTEEESNTMSMEIKEMLDTLNLSYWELDGVEESVDLIVECILDVLQNNRGVKGE